MKDKSIQDRNVTSHIITFVIILINLTFVAQLMRMPSYHNQRYSIEWRISNYTKCLLVILMLVLQMYSSSKRRDQFIPACICEYGPANIALAKAVPCRCSEVTDEANVL